MKLGVDADLCVVFGTFEEFWVSAGQAAIALVNAGLSAVVRIPVFSAILFSHDCCEVIAVSLVIWVFIFYFPGADCLIVHHHIFVFSASLIEGEDPV